MCFSRSRARFVSLAPAFPKKKYNRFFGRLLSHKESFSIETKNTFFFNKFQLERGKRATGRGPQIEPLFLFFFGFGVPMLEGCFSSSVADQAANVP